MQTRDERRMHEIDLARRLRGGDPSAFDEFANSIGSRLLGYTIVICGGRREDAEDVVQETLLQVYQKFGELREPDRVHAWFFRIARNVCLMKRRQECVGPAAESEPDSDIASRMLEPEIALLQAELAGLVHSAIACLPENYRMVVVLRCVEELSTEETSLALGVSEDVVRAWLHRARQALLKEFGKQQAAAGRAR